MDPTVQMIIFLSTIILIYGGLNSYVIFRLASLFSYRKRWVLAIITALLVLALPLTTMAEKSFPNIFTKMLYIIATFWMGMGFLFFVALLLNEALMRIFKYPKRSAGIIIIILVVLLSFISALNASVVSVKEVEIAMEGLSRPVTIAQMSDVHIGTIRNSGFLKKIINITNDIDPDIVVITGDLIDGSAPLHKGMFNEFNKLRGKVYFVSGNHETYAGTDAVYELLNGSKIKILENEVMKSNGLQIIGIDFSQQKGHLNSTLARLKINKNQPAVLLYHAPSEMEAAKANGIDLQLSGHTHNGQIFPFNLIIHFFFPKQKGLYDLDGMYMYVNPGTGTWGPYMRLGSNNEITVFNLVPDKQNKPGPLGIL